MLEKGLSTLLRDKIEVVGAGRTDAGVHAREMFAHFNVDQIPDRVELVRRLNAFLPEDIAVKEIIPVNEEAHARFDATERTYEYWVVQEKNPFYTDTAHFVKQILEVQAMNRAASFLLAHSDFECFSKSNTDVKTFNCDIKHAAWEKGKDKLVFTISADRFLRNMVRAIVGTLLDVGAGKMSPDEINTIIASKNRGKAGVSVPAKGLYLTKIVYPKSVFNEQE